MGAPSFSRSGGGGAEGRGRGANYKEVGRAPLSLKGRGGGGGGGGGGAHADMHRIASVHKYTCLLFSSCHTSRKILSRHLSFHANKTSPLFWNASYLVQSDHHQVQRNDILQDILQELTRCMHWYIQNVSTPITTGRTSLPKVSIIDHERASDSISWRQNFRRGYTVATLIVSDIIS